MNHEINTVHGEIRITLSGPLLIGGHSPTGHGLDAVTARDWDDRAVITASALRGALREAVYQLDHTLPPQEGPACCVPWDACAGPDYCVGCRIFGASGADRPGVLADQPAGVADGGWMRRGLRLGDAAPESPVAFQRRQGVSVDRFTGGAVEGRLFNREVADPGDGAIFISRFHGRLEAADLDFLRRAAALVCGIGNSQSRGLGVIEVEIAEPDAGPAAGAVQVMGDAFERGYALVRVRAMEPLHLGGIPDPGFFQSTERSVSGGALMGALFAAARRALTPAQAAALGDGLSFSDLLPAAKDDALPAPAPRTAAGCPYCKGQRRDLAIREAVARALAARGLGAAPVPTCSVCDDGRDAPALKPLRGMISGAALRSRIVTRLARDPHTGSFAHGLLHAREQLAPGARFVGTAAGVTGPALAAIDALAASGEPVYLGGMRSRGLGLVAITLEPARFDLAGRIERFQQDAEDDLEGLEALLGWAPSRLVLAAARTPLALDDTGAAPDRVGEALFGAGNYTVRGAWQRLGLRSGWSDQQGAPRAMKSVVREGSCWLFEHGGELDMDRLLKAEVEGISRPEDGALGMGRLILCPEIR